MTSWRPVFGTITRLDPDLTSEEDIQKLFADERICGRGQAHAENPAQFDFELAIAGRKRRVATLDEGSEIFKGRSLQNLAEYLHETLHAVEVRIPGTVLHGPMDLGAVDIDDSDLDSEDSVTEAGCALDAEPASGIDSDGVNSACALEGDTSGEETFTDDLPRGRGLTLADVPLSEVPMLATSQHQEIGTIKHGGLRVLLGQQVPHVAGKLLPSPDFSLSLVVADDHKPALAVTRMGRTLYWDWVGEKAPFEWTNTEEVARDFVRDELGAGGVARAAVADIIDVTFEDVRSALLAPAARGAEAFIAAVRLPYEVFEFVDNGLDMRMIPGIHICEPHGAAGAFTQTLAYECAGYGHINPGLAGAWRTMYLKRPWVTALVSAAQVGVGSVILATGVRKNADGQRSLWKMAAGGLLITSALSRIATTQYLNTAIERFVGDVPDMGADKVKGE